jgi:collagen type III alpha
LKGDPGERGEKGEAGLQGKEGPEGRPGREGRDGLPGLSGRDGDPGKDGLNGTDGKDGLSLEDFSASTEDDGRLIVLTFARGDVVVKREIKTAVVLDRGVYKPGQYLKGDGVTFAGSFFIAQTDTDARPETGTDWRLAVKRGRDGKDGKPGEKGDPGKDGQRGKDLTQMAPDGAKWG